LARERFSGFPLRLDRSEGGGGSAAFGGFLNRGINLA